jgi:hypothetical protein
MAAIRAVSPGFLTERLLRSMHIAFGSGSPHSTFDEASSW